MRLAACSQTCRADSQQFFDQTEYPITHFPGTVNLIIETPSLELSVSIAGSLLQKTWMRAWGKSPEAQVIAIQSRAGKVIQMGHRKFS